MARTPRTEIRISVDVEASGPSPSTGSLLSIGACLVDDLDVAFYRELQPIAGLAWEVPYGPHLVGHPVSQQIGHWIEIGGYNTSPSQVWYADPARTAYRVG